MSYFGAIAAALVVLVLAALFFGGGNDVSCALNAACHLGQAMLGN